MFLSSICRNCILLRSFRLSTNGVKHSFLNTERFCNMEDVEPEFRIKAFNLCREYIGGTWAKHSVKDFQIIPLRTGLSNYIYLCSLTSSQKLLKEEPRQVLLRIFGTIIREDGDAALSDSIIFSLLSERKQAPKLYGVFQEGRLEEYIPSRALHTDELSNSEISKEIARKLAIFHQLSLPLKKTATKLNEQIDRWVQQFTGFNSEPSAKKRDDYARFASYNFVEEAEFVKKLVSDSKSPVVFCHNDAQEGNILYCEGKDRSQFSLVLIDYEYAGYSYREYDFANHFAEWAINNNTDQYPYYAIDMSKYPTEEQQLVFFRSYMEAAGKPCSKDDEELFLREVFRFAVVTNFRWAMWSVVQENLSTTAFGFLEYAEDRLKIYSEMKKEVPARLNFFSD
ncbi:choline kinase alpha-like isoform X2 [Anneissia japonica]|uniref:choline kinase alpha-like isoform X2 n=1 Tax=Anneissia japonica TaxID=1529436 RepID=UPI00142571F0|nr:choline kinase alpha-like isoform X2 [Anneissia japonica]